MFVRLLLASCVVLAVGCSSTEPKSTAPPSTQPPPETSAPTTTEPAPIAPVLVDLAESGPFGVGVRTLTDADLTVEVWYPTTGESAVESYDLRDFTPEIIRNLLSDDANSVFSYTASRDADPADGVIGIVLFSHGFTGMRLQSTAITTHLASHGFIVAAPDHPSRDLFTR